MRFNVMICGRMCPEIRSFISSTPPAAFNASQQPPGQENQRYGDRNRHAQTTSMLPHCFTSRGSSGAARTAGHFADCGCTLDTVDAVVTIHIAFTATFPHGRGLCAYYWCRGARPMFRVRSNGCHAAVHWYVEASVGGVITFAGWRIPAFRDVEIVALNVLGSLVQNQ